MASPHHFSFTRLLVQRRIIMVSVTTREKGGRKKEKKSAFNGYEGITEELAKTHGWKGKPTEMSEREGEALTSIDISISGTQRYQSICLGPSTPHPVPPPRPALLHLPLVLSVYSSWNNYWDRYLQAMYVPDPWSLAGWNSNWLDCRTHHWATYKCAEKESVLYMEEVGKKKKELH